MVCKHYVQVPLLVYLLAVVEVELPNQFLVAVVAINPIPPLRFYAKCVHNNLAFR